MFTLQTLPTCDEAFDDGVGKVAGFSLHAGVAAKAHERKKLERLCRYISRPTVSEKWLSLTPNGNIRYQLKTPYKDGTPRVMLLRAFCLPPFGPASGCSKSFVEPLDFIARLAALVPKPRVNLTGFHGVVCPQQQAPRPGNPGEAGQGEQGQGRRWTAKVR